MTADVNATVSTLLSAGVSLAELKVRPRSLEDLFLQLTGKELRG
jgi:ABC-2 type transport system ATP-binding protein